MNLRDYFEATWNARARLLDAAAGLSPDEWTREFPFSLKSLRNLFGHVIEVEGSWVGENILREARAYPDEAEIARRFATVPEARDRSAEIQAMSRRALAEFVPGRLHEIRQGPDLSGAATDFTVEQILTHVFTHELRHQGQLQAMLRLLGKPAPNADWI